MVDISFDKLQHIYDLHDDLHAGDFGLYGNKNPQQLEKLGDAIRLHLIEDATRMIEGQYRGGDATLYYNSETQVVVVIDKYNQVVAGFKASAAQAGYILSTRRLS